MFVPFRPSLRRTPFPLVLAIGMLAALAVSVPATPPAQAQSCLAPNEDGVLWQIGRPDAPVATADLGALEYPADDTWVDTFEYTATGIDTEPHFPGYLAPKRLSEILIDLGFPGRRPTNAAREIVIDWEQCRGYNLVIEYGRFGSEEDDVVLDGVVVEGLSAGGENVDAEVESDPIVLPKAHHTLTLTYGGQGQANGHYIDYLRARLVECEEPADPFAVPDGYTFLTARRSPQAVTVEVPDGVWDLAVSVGEFNCSLRDGEVDVAGFDSVATPEQPGEAGVVTQTVGTVSGPDTLSVIISTDDPISVGVKIEAQQP